MSSLAMVSRMCEMCPMNAPSAATVFCDADNCFLCATCDEDVHQANRLAQRHIRRPVSAMDMVQSSGEVDVLVPDVRVKSLTTPEEVSSKGDSAEMDHAYADFDEFEGMTFGRMPVLTGGDSDVNFMAFTATDALKGFDSEDLSWGAVVPEDFEHVVPDIETGTAAGKPADLKAEISRVNSGIDMDAMVPAVPVVPTSTRPTGPSVRSTVVKAKPAQDTSAISAMSLAVGVQGHGFTRNGYFNFPSSPVSSSTATLPPSDASSLAVESKTESSESEGKTAEERKQMRMEALARFRSKRANRSFQKKIRYGCRKVLAESRPRVKGRFVRKADMALYRRYGANYVDFKGVEGALEGCDFDAVDTQ